MPHHGSPAFDWNDERVETLKVLLADKLSYSKIANRMGGGLTRNSVAGKIRRLGLIQSPKPKPEKPERPSRKSYIYSRGSGDSGGGTVVALKSRLANPRGDELCELPPDESPDAVPFLARDGSTCRYPLNETMPVAAHMVCGSPCGEEDSYCERHYRVTHDRTGTRRSTDNAEESAAEFDRKGLAMLRKAFGGR